MVSMSFVPRDKLVLPRLFLVLGGWLLGVSLSQVLDDTPSDHSEFTRSPMCWLTGDAYARSKPEAYPIIGAVSTRVSWNHSLLTTPATRETSDEYNVSES